ncbi:uncharacterized protein PITG_09530 [Phytophthora infestans T30-4]|uniref:Uncharacterized protein n=1 Tax=Phytophthora infestans (strain T30-4) TaxID=403677 RepID=D0NC76_PHYIT|nr:uncharacterized protein PITG_09530 [Phytophthora infestans T30-4]EEY55590.1 hypothetical protein PITG_09530 [Phytophthora infestans T30-4]|eukprot:XP_002903166.1 hypothetical protein PITG_09530 [Phytophthora infestans T30-4]
MTEANFVALLTQRVKRVSRKDKEAWNGEVFENLLFEFCVYCRGRDNRPTIHRATASRIKQATVAVQRYQQENDIALDPITMNHIVTTHARQPDETQFTLPDDNTTRQAMALDASMTTTATTHHADAKPHLSTIRLEINGNWNDFRVEVASLRSALGLPAHDNFTQGENTGQSV